LANATIDHMLSLIVFIAALMIFIGLFSQNIQSALAYEQHKALSTKASDLLDNVLLNPGSPAGWGKTDNAPVCFGVQDPDFMQYQLSSFSLMRLASSSGQSVFYPRTGKYFENLTTQAGGSLLVSTDNLVSFSNASKLLGLSSQYGFQLSVTTLLNISTVKISSGAPLTLQVKVDGTGFPLANAALTYNLLLVTPNGNVCPSYSVTSGATTTDAAGSKQLTFAGINGETQTYALIVYAYLDGLKGMGYFVHVPDALTQSVVPMVTSLSNRTVLLAHSDSVGQPSGHPSTQLNYNATFVLLSYDYTLRQIQLGQSGVYGNLTSGVSGQDYASLTVPDNYGILIVSYKNPATSQYGIVLMPWGLNSLAFSMTFGGNPRNQEWVSTDIRQVTIGGIAYQAKLGLWNLQGQQVNAK
jgi:hypothetical protein